MNTTCPVCGAALVQRVYLVPDGAPLFAETYACGSVHLWGAVQGDGWARACPKGEAKEPEPPASPSVGFDAAPAHYSGGDRETIDRQRDAVDDETFAAHCALCALKYLDRAGRKDPAKEREDLEKARWYSEMAEHVQDPEHCPDPRSQRPGFVPYERIGTGSGWTDPDVRLPAERQIVLVMMESLHGTSGPHTAWLRIYPGQAFFVCPASAGRSMNPWPLVWSPVVYDNTAARIAAETVLRARQGTP